MKVWGCDKEPRYSPELRERTVRMAYAQLKEHGSQWAAMRARPSKIGWSAQRPGSRARRDGIDADKRSGASTEATQILALWPDATCVGSLPLR